MQMQSNQKNFSGTNAHANGDNGNNGGIFSTISHALNGMGSSEAPTYTASPPPPPGLYPATTYNQLPSGWEVVTSPNDGRMYYWEPSTNKTSWTHPQASNGMNSPPPPPDDSAANTTRSKWGLPSVFGSNGNSFFGGGRGTRSSNWLDTPLTATRRPENHQCYAVVALILCPPIGACACFQSWRVDRSWQAGHYGDAVNHSRQASKYACFGCLVGVVFWLYMLFLRKDPQWNIDWPDWADWKFD